MDGDADRPSGPPARWGDEAGDPAPRVDPAVVRALDQITHPRRSWIQNLGFLALSVLLFFGFGLWDEPLPSVLVIIVALFVHELGHLAAMKLLGYSNVRIFFIPFFGAAVSGENVRAAGWRRAIVTLAGPMTGLAAALGLFVAWLYVDQPLLAKSAMVFAFLNVFNLLPLYPLDGGRFLQETLFSRNLCVEAAFRILMGGLTILAGIYLGSWVLPVIGLFVVVGTGASYKIGAAAAALRGRAGFPQDVDPRRVDEKVIRETRDALRERFPAAAAAPVEARRIWEVWEKVNARPPGALATAGFMIVYLLAFPAVPAAPFAIVALATKERIVPSSRPDGTPGRTCEVRTGRFLLHETPLEGTGLYDGTGREYSFGKLTETTSWRAGTPDGEWIRYDRGGQPAVVLAFEGGRFVSRKDFKPDGVLERKRPDLPSAYRALLDAAESRGPYGPGNRFGITDALLEEP